MTQMLTTEPKTPESDSPSKPESIKPAPVNEKKSSATAVPESSDKTASRQSKEANCKIAQGPLLAARSQRNEDQAERGSGTPLRINATKFPTFHRHFGVQDSCRPPSSRVPPPRPPVPSKATKSSLRSSRGKTIIIIVAAVICIAACLAALFWNRFWPFTEKAVVRRSGGSQRQHRHRTKFSSHLLPFSGMHPRRCRISSWSQQVDSDYHRQVDH